MEMMFEPYVIVSLLYTT